MKIPNAIETGSFNVDPRDFFDVDGNAIVAGGSGSRVGFYGRLGNPSVTHSIGVRPTSIANAEPNVSKLFSNVATLITEKNTPILIGFLALAGILAFGLSKFSAQKQQWDA